MKKFLLTFLFLFSMYSLFSQQRRSFSVDTLEYIDQLSDFMKNIGDERRDTVNRFINLWKSDSIPAPEKMKIISSSNLMLQRRAMPEPHFYNYLSLYLLKLSPDYSSLKINVLLDAFEKLVADKTIPFRDTERLLTFSLDIINHNNLYNLAGINWKALYGSYYFSLSGNRPVVVFNNFDLACYSNRDTMKIAKTSGFFDIMAMKWNGKGGKVSFEKAGLDPADVFITLEDYAIDVSRAQYSADSVLFHYKKYFDYPLKGRLEEKAIPITNPNQALYPKFFSYQRKYILPDLFKGIEFIGGLSMQGAKLVGTGSEDELARLTIFENDTLRMKLFTRNVLIRENGMNAQSVSLTLYLDNDSIYHPNLQFLFLENTDEIRLTKGDNFTSGVPFKNSYHKLDMNFEQLSWIRGSGIIKIQPSIGRASGQATFESYNFFNYRFFEEIQGRDYVNPLVSLWKYSKMLNNYRQFTVSSYAGYIGMADYQVRHQMMKLSRLGFLFFDEERDLIRLNDKLFYYLEASIGNTDYDVMFFTSKVDAPHEIATLNLQNKDLLIYGIPQIFLSDSQNVVLTPKSNQIIMKRNRNFQFGGKITAGLFSYYGDNFFFRYDSFKINLQDIDSMQLQVTESDKNTGIQKALPINNLIENITGELLIDDPKNKSGIEDFPQYPVFISRESSFVYFDEPAIQNGVYTRDKVYFELLPFSIDSLDNFSREGMLLKGQFYSDGLLPPIEQTLSLREDNSLGFIYSTPENGIPAYNGTGTIYNTIEMSNKGLRSSGRLDYLTSSTYSDEFMLHPDSVMANGREFEIRKQITGTEFPMTSSSDISIKWLTKNEKFHADMGERPFAMFNDSVILKGNLLIEPQGLSGKGTVDLVTSTLRSEQFKFLADNIISENVDFSLKSPTSAQMAISADSVKGNIDFKRAMGEFVANGRFAKVDFPAIRYISQIDYFSWDMKKELISMGNTSSGTTGQPEGPKYISMHPLQDSLSFNSSLAIYDYRKELLTATEVEYVEVADSRIFPDQGTLTVRNNAQMDKLSKARVSVGFVNDKYPLYAGNISIQGRNNYTGDASYDYIDMTGTPSEITFQSILVDSSRQTIAHGEVTVRDSFRLSPFFDFQGKYTLEARLDQLFFDGATRLTHNCDIGKAWLRFKSSIDPDSVMIPIPEQPLDINLNPIYFGSMITRDSTHIYSAFASTRKDFFDAHITQADGKMYFDPYAQKYEVASTQKLRDKSLTGNYLSLNTDSCSVYSEGSINFQVNYGQLKLTSPGIAMHHIAEDRFSTNVILALNFLFSEEALHVFAREIDSLSAAKPYDITSPFYRKALAELVGKSAVERMETDLGMYGELRTIPPGLNQTLILSEVKLQWNQLTRTFRYHGDIAVVQAGNRQINKKVEAYIELTKRSSGDLLDIYLQPDSRNWYYIGYNPGSLQVVSTNHSFNQIVMDTKESERTVKARKGTGYIYSAAADRRAQLFLRRFMADEDK